MVAATTLSAMHEVAGPVWAQRLESDRLHEAPADRVHDYMALAFFTEGSAVVEQGESFHVTAGDVYLVPAGERHGILSTRSPEAWGVGFRPSCYAPTELAPLLHPFECASAGAQKVIRIPGPRQQHLARLCEELKRESDHDSAHAEVVKRSLLALILSEIERARPRSPSPAVGFVGEALRFIERRCLGPITLDDIAASVHRSPSHVSTVVRRTTGRSVMQWIIAGRLAEARNRLLHSDEMVDVIAERVGYADATHFIRLFRREHGCTPAAWRAKQVAASSRRSVGRARLAE